MSADKPLWPAETPRTLDPADWGEFRRVGHDLFDRLIDYMATIGAGPVWQKMPEDAKSALLTAAPAYQPTAASALVEQLTTQLLPYHCGCIHPRFFGWVQGNGTPGGMLADMIAAAMNSNLGGRDHGAVYLERQVIEWGKDLIGLPPAASGLIVSGSSLATLIALGVARYAALGPEVLTQGVDRNARLIAYASSETHSCIAKSLDILGLGRNALRLVPVDHNFRIDVAALEQQILADRSAGLTPFCLVGSAGTVNTGAIDDLPRLAALAAEFKLWFHVDAAFGGLLRLSPRLASLVDGIEKADSVVFDFHKWLHVPYDAGCVLVRDGALHQAAFSTRPDYLAPSDRGLAGGNPWFCEFGPELSRGFRALKVWFTWQEQGSARIAAKIEDNCAQAVKVADWVDSQPDFAMLAPVALNIACFHYVPADVPLTALDELNRAIVADLQEQGIAAPSTTRLGGRLAIRACFVNHRTQDDDLALFFAGLRTCAAARLAELRS